MVEIKVRGFRLDIPNSQVITFKKSQNLNGVQSGYSYSNTFSLEKTANIKKLLNLTDLPSGKLGSLQNGFFVDLIFNGTIQLRNQKLEIAKETAEKVDLYIIFSDSTFLKHLKNLYVNDVVADLKYKKTISDFTHRADAVFVQTQSGSGQLVIEEMPLLINLRNIITRMTADLGYTIYGDFAVEDSKVKDYFVAPNAGIYQIYSGSGDGFSPSFDPNLTAFTLLNQTLAYFNSYATVDDTFRTIVINQWSNIGSYKNNFKNYSKFFLDYDDFSFKSSLARKNEMTYADSDATFNSFFTNNLSSQDKAVYLASPFGSGSTQLFDDSDLEEDGTIPLRVNGEKGETSALRIYKISEEPITQTIFSGGLPFSITAKKAVSIPMRVVFNDFHKAYVDFILTPIIQALTFRYDDILATDFSLTEVFFIEQQSAYWIPLEISFSSKKDAIKVKAMLIKERKVLSPILNNFNSLMLDFKQRKIFPKTLLQTMYPIPPNEHQWDEVVFKSYNQDINRLYVNGALVPSASLPQVYNLSALDENAIEIEANKLEDIYGDFNSDSLYLQAVDTNGGISNEAYINIKHTGVARLESNFMQNEDFHLEVVTSQKNQTRPFYINVLEYYIGLKPNLNDTITSAAVISREDNTNADFNLVASNDNYANVKIEVEPFEIDLKLIRFRRNVGGSCWARVMLFDGVSERTLKEVSVAMEVPQTFSIPRLERVITSLPAGRKIQIYVLFQTRQSSGRGHRYVKGEINIRNMKANISTIKYI